MYKIVLIIAGLSEAEPVPLRLPLDQCELAIQQLIESDEGIRQDVESGAWKFECRKINEIDIRLTRP